MAGMQERYNVIKRFTRGENTLLAPSELGDDQAAKLTNLIPNLDGDILAVRGGLTTVHTVGTVADGASGLYRYMRSDQGAGQLDYDIASFGGRVYYRNASTGEWVLLYTFPNKTDTIRFSVLLDKLFMSNGVDPIRCWDGDPDNAPVVVEDTQATPPRPVFPYVITFRDRLWLAGVGSTVAYCGSSDDGKPRWQSWSGTAPSDGGSLVIGADDGQRVTGLASLTDQLIIFKSRNTYIWSYSDDAIPKTEGTISPLIRGVGCASHDTIRYRLGSAVFLGQSDDGDYAVYVVSGSGVEKLSEDIPAFFQRILRSSEAAPKAFIHGDVYYLAVDTHTGAGTRSLVYAYDFSHKAWYEVAGWQVGAFGRSDDGQRLRVASSTRNTIGEYPLGDTDDGEPIAFGLSTRVIDGGNPFMDKRWRDVAIEVAATVPGQGLTLGLSEDGGAERRYNLVTNTPHRHTYGDGLTYNSGGRFAIAMLGRKLTQELTTRARYIQLHLTGEALGRMSLLRLMATVRSRKVRYE